MEKDSGHALSELAVDGGMSNSDLAMQVRPPSPPPVHKTSLDGRAYELTARRSKQT